MSLSAPRGTASDLVEEWTAEPVVESSTPFEGIIFDVVRERVDLGAGGVVTRDFVTHPGAVAVLALRELDGAPHVLLIPIDESALRRRWVADDDVTMDEPEPEKAESEKAGDPALDRA